MTRRKHKNNRQRLLIAQQAAVILSKSGNRDFLAAKTKAAQRMGVLDTNQLPTNIEIEQALIDYHRLFCSEQQPKIVRDLRQAALKAMRIFSDYSPKLVGSVLAGTADEHSPVHLHIFADTAEELTIFLINQHIPFDVGEQKIRFGHDSEQIQTTFSFIAGEVNFLLTVFIAEGQRQAPMSPVDGKTMKRANLSEVENLLE